MTLTPALTRRSLIGLAAAALPGAALACRLPVVEARMTEAAAAPASLAGTAWRVVRIGAQEVPEGVEAGLIFEAAQVSGSTGCNSLGGSYAFAEGTLTFGLLRTTRRACLGAGDAVERAFLAALAGPLSVVAGGPGALRLVPEAGDEIALVRAAP